MAHDEYAVSPEERARLKRMFRRAAPRQHPQPGSICPGLLKLLGDIFIAAFIVVMVLGSCSSKAATAKPVVYTLVLMVYSSAAGHGDDFRSYHDVIRVPGFQTLETCDAAGEFAIDHFRGNPQQYNLSVDLLDFICLPVVTK